MNTDIFSLDRQDLQWEVHEQEINSLLCLNVSLTDYSTRKLNYLGTILSKFLTMTPQPIFFFLLLAFKRIGVTMISSTNPPNYYNQDSILISFLLPNHSTIHCDNPICGLKHNHTTHQYVQQTKHESEPSTYIFTSRRVGRCLLLNGRYFSALDSQLIEAPTNNAHMHFQVLSKTAMNLQRGVLGTRRQKEQLSMLTCYPLALVGRKTDGWHKKRS